jgi:hypothetical protein
MTIETCLRCGRARDDADEEAYDDEWMPIFSTTGRRANVVCSSCALPADQAALEQWIDDFDKHASRRSALQAAASTADDPATTPAYRGHERFVRLFIGVDLQRLSVSQVDHWISAWGTYNELVRLPPDDRWIQSKATELATSLRSLETAGVAPEGSADALALAYGITPSERGGRT